MTTTDNVPPRPRAQPDPLHQALLVKLHDRSQVSAADLAAAVADVLMLAREAEHQALRGEDQLAVPEWVRELRVRVAGALGVTAMTPEDR